MVFVNFIFLKYCNNMNIIVQVLGSGFEVIIVGKRKLVHSVPTELKTDLNEVLELSKGLAMIDDGHRDGKRRYWFPCVSSVSSFVASETL
ncbi:putative Snf8/Vps36 family protein [Helianthus annuus]|nr:putative Snf8/Vps36 family protein [Helianthus annuus]